MKKTIMALAVPSIMMISSLAIADLRPEVKSNLSPTQSASIDSFTSKNKALDELNYKERILEAESKIVALQLEKAKAEIEIDKIKHPEKYAKKEPDASTSFQNNSMQNFNPIGQAERTAPRKIIEEDNLDLIYVTKIYGIDNRLSVTAYYKGSIMELNTGDEVDDGIRLVKIVKSGAVFSDGKKTKRVSMTTGYNAYKNTFVSDDDGDSREQNNMAMPIR